MALSYVNRNNTFLRNLTIFIFHNNNKKIVQRVAPPCIFANLVSASSFTERQLDSQICCRHQPVAMSHIRLIAKHSAFMKE